MEHKGEADTEGRGGCLVLRFQRAIRQYFLANAVTSDREVQVFRRRVSGKLGGKPGSKLDLLVRVPAAGSAKGTAIAIRN